MLAPVTGEEAPTPVKEKEERFLLKIIDLCRQQNLPLILIKTPTAHRAEEQPYYQTIKQIAADAGIPFYNLNEMDAVTGITPEDYWTDDNHLNSKGAAKVTHWLARLLREQNLAPDRRGDARIASWDENFRYLDSKYEEERNTAGG